MAKVSEEKLILNVLNHLNETGLPWQDAKFVVNDDEVIVLGYGGFAQVVLMENTNNLEIKYAVKILGLKADKRIHQNDYEKYKTEAVVQYNLASECDTIVNILGKSIVSVKINDVGEVEDFIADGSGADKLGWLAIFFIKMEKLEKIIEDTITGDRLFCLPKLKDLDEKTSLEFAIDIAKALYTSHENNVMHRDVKLENIFFDRSSGKFKLGDFGIAKITNNGSASTKGAGTLGYEAPEVTEECGGKDKYTYKADIYSYGATLYILLNNLRFPGSSTYNVERSVQYNPNGIIDNPEKGLPELNALVCRCMQYNPENRPESMEIILYELYRILEKYYGEGKTQGEPILEEDATLLINSASDKDNVLVENNVASHEQATSSDIWKEESTNKIIDIPTGVAGSNNAAIGSVVAEAEVEKLTDVKKKVSSFKLYMGFGLMLIGLLLLEFLTLKSENVNYGMFSWILCGVSVVFSCVSFVRKCRTGKKLPYSLYILLMCFTIFVLFTEVNMWPIVLLAIGLFIGGVSETFVVSIAATLYPVVGLIKNTGIISWLFNEKILFICLIAVILGFFWLEQYDAQEGIIFMLFSETIIMLLWSIVITIAGIVLGILKLLSVIDASSLLVNMHLLYVGITLLVVGIVQSGKEG